MRHFLSIAAPLALGAALAGCTETGIGQQQQHVYRGDPQAVEPETVVDTFVQNSPTQADVLFVISNWWSMEQAYTQLVDDFTDMLQVFIGSGMDYHIGVVSTDVEHSYEQGKLNVANGWRWVEEATPDPINTFAVMATMDATGCAGPRAPRDATYLALVTHKNDEFNQGFRRDAASMHTVFVSDDKDLSTMQSFDEWVNWYNSFTDTPDLDTLSTIVDYSKDGQNLIATQEIGGTSQEIKVLPWANVLQEIGLRAQGARQEFFLSRQPQPDSIEVKLTTPDGAEQHYGDFTYDGDRNSITFTTLTPVEGSLIEIDYTAL